MRIEVIIQLSQHIRNLFCIDWVDDIIYNNHDSSYHDIRIDRIRHELASPSTGEQPNKIVGYCRIIDNNKIYSNIIINNDNNRD